MYICVCVCVCTVAAEAGLEGVVRKVEGIDECHRVGAQLHQQTTHKPTNLYPKKKTKTN